MRSPPPVLIRITVTAALAVAAGIVAQAGHPARADVTVEQQMTMDLAGMKIDTTTVERTSADKQRRDSTTHCHGVLSLFCGNAQSGQIVRLDKQVQWDLQPKKRLYTQTQFPTPEQRAQAQQKYQQLIEQMRQCPVPQSQPGAQSAPDTSQCQLSPPTVNVTQTGEHASVAGHDTHKSSVVLSQTCTDVQTHDICQIDYGFDLWLTNDEIAGAAERKSFSQNYLAAQGLDPSNPQLQGMMQQFMAPYADTLRQLQIKASSIQGYPLRTTFYMAFGGPHCARARQAQASASSTPNPAPRRHGFGLGSLASSAVGGGLSGLLGRHGADAGTSAAAGQVGANAADAATSAAKPSQAGAGGNSNTGAAGGGGGGGGGDQDTSMQRMVAMTVETQSIDTGSIAPDQFEVPSDWKLQPPKPQRDQQFTCPAPSH